VTQHGGKPDEALGVLKTAHASAESAIDGISRQPLVTQDRKKASKTAPDNPDATFDEFWALYPRKTHKKDALKVWIKINPSRDLCAEISRALKLARQSVEWRDPQYIPYPATWLNGECWADQVLTQSDISRAAKPRQNRDAAKKEYVYDDG
jgi:hypothetical protein